MNDYNLDSPEEPEMPEWYLSVEDFTSDVELFADSARSDSDIVSTVEVSLPEAISLLCKTTMALADRLLEIEQRYQAANEPEPLESCDACDHESDLAYDAARESR